MAITGSQKIEALEEILIMMDEAAETLRRLDDPRINAYVLAEFEGKNRGWLGTFARDYLEEALEAERNPEDDAD